MRWCRLMAVRLSAKDGRKRTETREHHRLHRAGHRKGDALELMRFKHPFTDFDVPAILGDHVTLDAGTGAVHTAGGHGLTTTTSA